jgi:flagellar hook-basal body complex protein FliE
MCVACLAVSALTFIIPASPVPQSPSGLMIAPANSTQVVRTQISPGVSQMQTTLRAMLKQVPDSADTQVLRKGLEFAVVRLNTAKTNQQAQALLDEEMDELAQVIIKAPNAQALIDLTLDIRDRIEGLSAPSGSDTTQLQSNAASILLQKGLQLHQRSGWLS